MSKKQLFVSLVVAIVLTGMMAGFAEAQPNVGSVSKRGSLLIFPQIYTANHIDQGVTIFDTIVQIGNDAAKPVTVKCYWMDWAQNTWDFEFTLTPYQPVWFSAKTGEGSINVSPFGVDLQGELKCWAVDTSTDPESLRQFNYLYGSATLLPDTSGISTIVFEYNAWAFALRSQPANPTGPLTLNGTTDYDACPAYLSYNFFASGSSILDETFVGPTWLALSPCQQDLRQDRSPVCTKAKYDIWNENESKFTGAHQCIKCTSFYFHGIYPLEVLGQSFATWGGCDLGTKCKPVGVGGSKFSKAVLHTDMGRFRVTPSTFSACSGVFAKLGQDAKTVVDVCSSANQYQTPFVGVLMTSIFPGDLGQQQVVGSVGVGAGSWTAPKPIPQILWDADTGTVNAAKR
jgi:hypothetical protein